MARPHALVILVLSFLASSPALAQQPRAGAPATFCQPGVEIRCSCGPKHWETTRCRDDGSNWEFCPCPDGERPELPKHRDRTSPRSTPLIGSGVALTALGAAAFGTSLALELEHVPDCTSSTTTCVRGWIPVIGGGLVLTAVGIPLWIAGAAPVHSDERPRDTAIMVTGSFAAGLGVVALGGGVTALATGDPHGWWPVGFGGAGLIGGVVLAVYGGWEVADVPPRAPDSGSRTIRLAVGPRGMIISGAF